ncbi:MAG: hypothetical protein IKD04_01815 [Clostridia bacterium]|nr:hypothetical protein [Clostridia bacterium]
MNYFNGLDFKRDTITVLGAEKNSDFVTALLRYLETKGSVTLTDDKAVTDKTTDYLVIAPDEDAGKRFRVHSEAEISSYKEKGAVIGVISVEALLKDIENSVIGAEDFCAINDMSPKDLVYPLALARVITNREKYDMLYIDDVSSAGKRYTAREINRRITYGAGVRIINTDTDYVEALLAPSLEVL